MPRLHKQPMKLPPLIEAMKSPTVMPYNPHMVPMGISTGGQQPMPVVVPVVSEEQETTSILGLVFAVIMGVLLLALGLFLVFKKDKKPNVAEATLSNVSCADSICTMDLTFTDTEKRQHIVPKHRVSGDGYTNGQKVSIRYNPSDPKSISINFIQPMVKPIVGWFLAVAGVILLGYAAFAYLA